MTPAAEARFIALWQQELETAVIAGDAACSTASARCWMTRRHKSQDPG